MYCNFAFVTLAVLIGHEFVSAQQIPPSTTAGELWNPWTWFWPYAIASAEAYKDYYEKSQKATNELYQQIYKTNAFPWVTGKWGEPQTNPGEDGKQNQPDGDNEQKNPSGGNEQSNPGGEQSDASKDQGNPTEGEQTNPSENSEQSNPSNGGDQANPTENAPESDPNSGSDQPNTDDSGPTEQPSNAQVQGGVQGNDAADAEVAGDV